MSGFTLDMDENRRPNTKWDWLLILIFATLAILIKLIFKFKGD